MKKKALSYYLDLIISAQSKQEWNKVKRYGETAFKKLTTLSYSPFEEYLLHCRLGHAYGQMAEYSRSLDSCYKAYLIASKNNLAQSYIIYTSYMMGYNLLFMRNINQALFQLKKVEEYYQSYGNETIPMDNKKYFSTLIGLGNCYLYKGNFKDVKELIEKKIPISLQSLSDKAFGGEYYLLKGEYQMKLREYNNARQSFQECIKISEQLNLAGEIMEAKIDMAVIDLLEHHLDTSIQALESILKDAKRLNLNAYAYVASFLLSKCYYLKNMPDKSASIENHIKPFLNKLDIVWMYEISRAIEQIYKQTQLVYHGMQTDVKTAPAIITDTLKQHYADKFGKDFVIIGQSKPMQEIYQLIDKIAPTDLPVLIHGETGTGKELIARAIHNNSPRSGKPWLALNCGAIPETLLENELFGHAKGAFTDAREDRRGHIELASDGTLFLDEIGDMSSAMQQKLLRALEEKIVWRLGATKSIPVNNRFIFASNQNIEELVKAKKLREDLYYRINTIVITLPPLRERKEDIPLLVEYFIKKYATKRTNNQQLTTNDSNITPDALNLLMNYPWPGNVRELENEIKRICVLYPNDNLITESTISKAIRSEVNDHEYHCLPSDGKQREGSSRTLKELRESAERNIIIETLKKCQSDVAETAKILGYNRTALYKKIKQLKIETCKI